MSEVTTAGNVNVLRAEFRADLNWKTAQHYMDAEEWQRKQAGALADVLMEIIIAVDPPYEPKASGPLLFGAYPVAGLLNRIRELVR